MTRFVALLRAVNVGGHGRLKMQDLVAACQAAGFSGIRTHGASGNAVFSADGDAGSVRAALARALRDRLGAAPDLFLREAAELRAILEANPFRHRDAKFTVAIFLDRVPGDADLSLATGTDGEDLALGAREIYVHYPRGQGRSKLRLPAAAEGTARNMNTIARLAAMAEDG